ncbi:Transport permease protein OS=Streptomyces tendae OX=1932 GN=GUR47_21955 PE=3 SV=1 [Streptomyces tendae]
MLPAAIGFSLLFAVYSALVGVFVVRREELVLKRLRTGELRDVEILSGSALPAVLSGLVQSLLLAVGCAVLLDLSAPSAG